jgi:hypothetical protein
MLNETITFYQVLIGLNKKGSAGDISNGLEGSNPIYLSISIRVRPAIIRTLETEKMKTLHWIQKNPIQGFFSAFFPIVVFY